jgi:hypothetical protein
MDDDLTAEFAEDGAEDAETKGEKGGAKSEESGGTDNAGCVGIPAVKGPYDSGIVGVALPHSLLSSLLLSLSYSTAVAWGAACCACRPWARM